MEPVAGLMIRKFIFILLVLCLEVPSFTALVACPFCTMQGQTLTGDVNAANLVLFGTLKNAKLLSNGD